MRTAVMVLATMISAGCSCDAEDHCAVDAGQDGGRDAGHDAGHDAGTADSGRDGGRRRDAGLPAGCLAVSPGQIYLAPIAFAYGPADTKTCGLDFDARRPVR